MSDTDSSLTQKAYKKGCPFHTAAQSGGPHTPACLILLLPNYNNYKVFTVYP